MTAPDANGWLPVSGWGGRYQIHESGEIRTTEGSPVGSILRPDGYVCVRLTGGGERSMVRLHRLVAATFCPNPHALPVVNHIDHNPGNNAASNLEWCTQKQNLEHARVHGRMPNDHWTGRRSPNAALSDEQVTRCRILRGDGFSFAAIACRVGSNKRTVMRVIAGESYAHVR